ncbi:MAG: hypothetical protein QM533_12930 [Cytophagales bacterium]|nr:hypothetical protein [Cytophagales bacterium]
MRERTWKVVYDWHTQEPSGSLVMVWRDLNEVGASVWLISERRPVNW